MVEETEIAWAAGFFDGEGSSFAVGPGKRLQMKVNQVDPRPLLRFQAAVGGDVRGPYKKPNPNSNDYWNWQPSLRKAHEVYALLRPYLSPPKIQQAEKVIEGELDLHIGRPFSPAVAERDREIVELFGELSAKELANRFGVSLNTIHRAIRKARAENV
jgi:hypothetical protein